MHFDGVAESQGRGELQLPRQRAGLAEPSYLSEPSALYPRWKGQLRGNAVFDADLLVPQTAPSSCLQRCAEQMVPSHSTQPGVSAAALQQTPACLSPSASEWERVKQQHDSQSALDNLDAEEQPHRQHTDYLVELAKQFMGVPQPEGQDTALPGAGDSQHSSAVHDVMRWPAHSDGICALPGLSRLKPSSGRTFRGGSVQLAADVGVDSLCRIETPGSETARRKRLHTQTQALHRLPHPSWSCGSAGALQPALLGRPPEGETQCSQQDSLLPRSQPAACAAASRWWALQPPLEESVSFRLSRQEELALSGPPAHSEATDVGSPLHWNCSSSAPSLRNGPTEQGVEQDAKRRHSKRLRRKEAPLPAAADSVSGKLAEQTESKIQPQFARLATQHLLRNVLCGGNPESESASSSIAEAVLQTECKRQRVLKGRILGQMHELARQWAVHDRKEARVAQLLGRLDSMRRGTFSLEERLPDVLQIAEDLNDARNTSAVVGSKVVGLEFGRRCRVLSVLDPWHHHRAPCARSFISLALAYGQGDHGAGEELVIFSAGPFARVRCTVRQLSSMTNDAYRSTFIESTEAIKPLLEPEPVQDGSPLSEASVWRASQLAAEITFMDHLFYLENPTHYSTGDPCVWAMSDVPLPAPRLAMYEEAVRRAGFSVEQRAVLWRIWDERSWRLKELEYTRARLQAHLVQLLRSLQLSERAAEESANYSDLLDAVAKLRGNLNEAAVTNSVAISRTVMGVLTPLQIATMVATMYPYVINPLILYDHQIIKRPDCRHHKGHGASSG